MFSRFPETLRTNGVEVQGIVRLRRPFASASDIANFWDKEAARQTVAPSHLLVLTPAGYTEEVGSYYSRIGRVEFALWETSRRRVSWVSHALPALHTEYFRTHPRAVAERSALDLLKYWNAQGLITLAHNEPRTVRGTNTTVNLWENDT